LLSSEIGSGRSGSAARGNFESACYLLVNGTARTCGEHMICPANVYDALPGTMTSGRRVHFVPERARPWRES